MPAGSSSLAAVSGRGQAVLTFVVSFLVIGQFWTAHHRTFGLIHRQDQTLLWLNLLVLLTVAFLPFPAAVLGARTQPTGAFPVVFFAASMTVTSCALTAVWLYAARRGLLRPSVGPLQIRMITVRAAITPAVFALSVPAALLGLPVAVALWMGVLPLSRVLVTRVMPAE